MDSQHDYAVVPAEGERDPKWLTIYLNDHLTGATGGVELARRTAGAHRDTPLGPELSRIADEIAEDRTTLTAVMARLGVEQDRLRATLGWIAHRAGYLKLNGRVLRRSPLSSLLELEMLQLGVAGKAALWASLRAANPVDADAYEELLARASAQAETLQRLRLTAASAVLVPPSR